MKQLIWKEYREKRWWFLPMAVYPIVCILTNHGYIFLGLENTTPLFGVLISWLIALLMGLTAYAPELGGGTADFLYAKPAGWKRILGAKLALGLAFVIASTLLAAVVFRIHTPAPYLRFVGIGPLASGAGIAVLFMFSGYMLGMVCSVALPGMLGSILTLASVLALFAAAAPLVNTFAGGLVQVISRGLVVITGAAMLAAGLAVIRFGLTLSLGARIRRYALVFAAVLVLGSVTFFAYALASHRAQSNYTDAFWSFSPSGKYASRTAYYRKTLRIYRLSDGVSAEVRIPGISFADQGWTPSDKVFALFRDNRRIAPSPTVLRLMWLDRDGKLSAREMSLPIASYVRVTASPSGRRALVDCITWAREVPRSSDVEHRLVVDLEAFRVLDVTFRPGITSTWWVSDSELAYQVGENKTVFRLRLPSP